jgi:hypothetical protein
MIINIIINFFLNNQGYLSNRLPNCIQAYKTNMTKLRIYTPQTTCQCACENQIETVVSHAVKEVTQLNSLNKVIMCSSS